MYNSRPKNLNLLTIRFPLPAIVSILHRISGVILFLMIPILLWLLDSSLTLDGFVALQDGLGNFFVKLFAWLLLVPLCFHLVAGIRHLLMDMHVGTDLKCGRLAAKLVIIVSVLLIILAGIWLW